MTRIGYTALLLLVILLSLVSCSNTATDMLDESAAPAALTLEPIEENKEEAGATNGKTAVLLRTGERARFEIGDVQSGTYKVSVRARGDNYEGWPVMRLTVNNQQLGEDVLVGSNGYREYTFGEVALSSRQVIEAVFTNDNYDGSADRDRNLYVDQLTLTPLEGAKPQPDTRSNCTDERLELGTRGSPVWTSGAFEGTFCRDIVGDGESLTLTLDAKDGGFDTAIVSEYNPSRVDDLRTTPLPVSATVAPEFSGSGNWWIGPKFSVREEVGQGLEGNYENYIVENASRTPEEYHERLTSEDGGTYLGETRQDGGVYRHYLVPHPYQPWEQFWAVRQVYRESGAVDLALILEKWRANGLPDQLIPQWRVNVETSGEIAGTLVMKDISFPASNAEQAVDQSADWDVVYEGLEQSEPLELRGVSNILVRNSTFTDIAGSNAIFIEDATNVRVENVTIDGVTGKRSLNGVLIKDSTEVSVVDSTISNISSRGQSAGIRVVGAESANITFQGNHIYDTQGNGIVSGGCSACAAEQTVHDAPVPGLRIVDNLIHDTGKTPETVEGSPTHGMYIKAQDAWIEGNTVYNAFDGSGISVRSTATVVNNRVWDTKYETLVFYQMKPAGPSMRSVIRGNELFFTDSRPSESWKSWLLKLYWNKSKGPLRYDTFDVRDNTLSMCTTAAGTSALTLLHPFENLTVEGNDFVDRRDRPRYFADLGTPSEYVAGNTFNEVGCLSP